MSDFLLQKSFKLLSDSKHIKRTKKSEKQRLKKKKICLTLKENKEEQIQNSILRNLMKLEELGERSAVNISEKVLPKCEREPEQNQSEEEDEPTVFTDKDFEDFEKEYFGS